MITLTNINKTFVRNKIETLALCGINLEVAKGEFVAITGPSGCGKSTLLNVLGMMDAPTSGSYRLNGEDVYARTEKQLVELRNRDIGFVFQSFNLLDSPTVFENVELPLIYRKMPKAERRTKVTEVLERLGLGSVIDFRPSELSGGEQQRVAVARALVGDPKLILADEPTGNLDSKAGEMVLTLLSQLHAHGATILMVTHSMEYAQRGDRVIRMLDGRIASLRNCHSPNYRSRRISPFTGARLPLATKSLTIVSTYARIAHFNKDRPMQQQERFHALDAIRAFAMLSLFCSMFVVDAVSNSRENRR